MRTPLVRHAFAFALTCFVLEPNSGCHHPCPLLGCASRLSVEMLPPAAGFAEGSYTFSWESDDDQGGCEFVMTSGAACPEFESQPCVVESNCETEFMRTEDRIIVDIDETPESLHITLEQGERVVLDAEVTPDYSTSQPNGPGCDPVCTEASVELQLSS